MSSSAHATIVSIFISLFAGIVLHIRARWTKIYGHGSNDTTMQYSPNALNAFDMGYMWIAVFWKYFVTGFPKFQISDNGELILPTIQYRGKLEFQDIWIEPSYEEQSS